MYLGLCLYQGKLSNSATFTVFDNYIAILVTENHMEQIRKTCNSSLEIKCQSR